MSEAALREDLLPHYTYNDYAQWEGKWELIHGIPFSMVPAPTITHQRICKRIETHLDKLLENCTHCEVFLPVDWQITEDTVVQPDVLIVCGDLDNIGPVKLEVTPVVVFEVISPSTKKKDRLIKYDLYEKAGVKYYCIIDPAMKSATVFSLQTTGQKYEDRGEFREGKIPLDLGPCIIDVDFGEIFR